MKDCHVLKYMFQTSDAKRKYTMHLLIKYIKLSLKTIHSRTYTKYSMI
jgi:hypothetical protein